MINFSGTSFTQFYIRACAPPSKIIGEEISAKIDELPKILALIKSSGGRVDQHNYIMFYGPTKHMVLFLIIVDAGNRDDNNVHFIHTIGPLFSLQPISPLASRGVSEQHFRHSGRISVSLLGICTLSFSPHFLQIFRTQWHLDRSKILFEPLEVIRKLISSVTNSFTHVDLCGARNGNDIVTLCEEPSQSDLTGRGFVLLTDLLQAISELQDLRKILFAISE